MILPAIIFCAVCGAMLITGGILMGANWIMWVGGTFWVGGIILLIHAALNAWRDAYVDYKVRKILGKRNFGKDYRPGRGLR